MPRLNSLNAVPFRDAPHFTMQELECKGGVCCGYSVKVRPELLAYLEALRAAVSEEQGHETPIHIHSGFRCVKHNQEVGGVHHSDDPRDTKNSFHVQGMAVDISVIGVAKQHVAKLADEIGLPRVGLYKRALVRSRPDVVKEYLVLHLDIADPEVIGTRRLFGNGWPDGYPGARR